MRKIKFRAWDKIDKKMLSFNDIEINGYYPWGSSWEHHVKKCPYIWMQYTGLKDKNGNEIYEGDIVEYKSSNFRGEVKYSTIAQCSFRVWNINNDDIKDLHLTSDLEIIGNIYEHGDKYGIK